MNNRPILRAVALLMLAVHALTATPLTAALTAPPAAMTAPAEATGPEVLLEATCSLDSWASGGMDTTPCWVLKLGAGIFCLGCVAAIINPVPGDELVACHLCLGVIQNLCLDGCIDCY